MTQLNVRIVKLDALRAASAWGFGPGPEEVAWQKLAAWAGPRGLLDSARAPRIFGFNNPSPSVGSPNYGYEFWLVVAPDVEPADDIRLQAFAGGLYAVLPIEVSGNLAEVMPAAWQELDKWVADSAYRPGTHQWLEEHSPAGLPIALYYPIVE